MERENPLPFLLDNIRSGLDASKLMDTFNETCRNSSKTFSRSYLRRWFLNFAIEYQNSQLVTLLLSDLFDDLLANPRCKCVDFPVIPMPAAFLTRAEVFLRSCSSMNLTSTVTNDLTYSGPWHDVWSPFEYACVIDQPGILKILISSYGGDHPLQRLA